MEVSLVLFGLFFLLLIGCFGLVCFLASYLKDKYKARQLNASRRSANFSGYCLFPAVPDEKKDQAGLYLPGCFPQHKVDFFDIKQRVREVRGCWGGSAIQDTSKTPLPAGQLLLSEPFPVSYIQDHCPSAP